MKLDTTEYFFSHGKEPRGYGNWFFDFKSSNGAATQKNFVGKFSDAKKSALAYARTISQCWTVIVCP